MENSEEFVTNIAYPAGRFDGSFNIVSGNNQVYSLLGNHVYVSLYKLVPDKDRQKLENDKNICISDGREIEECIHIVNDSGGYDTYIIYMERCQNPDFLNIRFINVTDNENRINDLTDRLRIARDFLTVSGEILFKYVPAENIVKLFWVNHEQTIVIYDNNFDEWSDMVVGKKYVEDEDRTNFDAFCKAVRNMDTGREFSFNSKIVTKGGRLDYNKIKLIRKVYGSEEMIIGIWSVMNALTGGKIMNFVEDSYIDPLTKILNKKAITDYAMRAVSERKDKNIAMAIMDIDNFKNVNDTYGHMFGDKVIMKTAEVIKCAIGSKSVAGRMGGDEFMIIFNDYKDELNLRNMLRCIKTNMASIYQDIIKTPLSCSIGVSIYGRDSADYKEMFKIADKSLYIAKQKGKNRYIIYEPEKHGQFMVNDNGTDMLDIREAFYSEKDIFTLNRLLAKVVSDGRPYIQALFDKAASTLMLDRINLYWEGREKQYYANSSAADMLQADANVLCNTDYIKIFNNNMIVLNNINMIEYSIPEVYSMLKSSSTCSTMQYLLRDRDGEIKGIVFADGCQKMCTFPKIAVSIFENMCEILNAVMIR